MGLYLQAQVTCDRCRASAPAMVEVTKLNPAVSMHAMLPTGWSISSKESGELYLLCNACPVGSRSLAPGPPVTVFPDEDPSTGPTLRPPPLPKPIPKKEG